MKIRVIKAGDKFGILTVVSLNSIRNYKKFWNCICECGNTSVVVHHCLKPGFTKSCGCLRKIAFLSSSTTHGLTRHPLYKVYSSIKYRCYSPNCREFKYYGEKGIIMCNEWLEGFIVFYEWCMLNGWEKGLEIDRIKSSGNYEPDNCRIVTKLINLRNRGVTLQVNYLGENISIAELADKTGVKYHTLRHRIVKLNMPLDMAVKNVCYK